MKNLLLFASLLLCVFLSAQTTCETALPFCAGGVSGTTFPATTGTTVGQPGPNYGCLGSTPNPAWYYLQIGTSGSLDILIQGVATSPPGPGQDVDFICWGPFNTLAGICNSLTASNIVDCSYSASFTETLNIAAGVTGQYYLVLITNFANVPQNIVFTQYGGTGNTNCGLLSTNLSICAGSNASITTAPPSGLSNVTYSLFPGNLTSTTPTFVITPSVTATYSIYATGVNTLNTTLTQSATANVTVNTMPSVVPTTTNTTCTSSVSAFNLGLSFTPSVPATGYTVSWATIPNGVTNPTQTSVSGFINPGVYTATVTAAGGCSVLANFTINPKPAPASFTLTPFASVYSITCYQPILTIGSGNPNNTYTWTNGNIAPINDPTATISIAGTGNWTVTAINPISGCVATKTFVVGQNTVAPTAAITPSFQNITCSLSTITTVTMTASPTLNILQVITAPSAATFSSNASSAIYSPGGPGTYTYCVYNSVNGCSTCKNFTVASNQGFPTFNVTSPQSFTLGCNTKSVAIINIINGNTSNPSGGAVSYSILAPGNPGITGPGALTNTSTYTVASPGTYTVITKDNVSFCETRVPVSVISNTAGPALDSVLVPQQILDCNTPSITLQAFSGTPNTGYNWSFPGVVGNLPTSTITIKTNSLAPTTTVIATYTLTLTDNNNTCVTTSIIPMYQNIFPPFARISNGGVPALTCKTSTILLTNISSTGIPPNSIFPTNIVVGYIWDGPSPQTKGQVNSTYIAATVGDYTLLAKDYANGCTSQTVINIADGRQYPAVNTPSAPDPFILDCGSNFVNIKPIISTPTTNLAYSWQLPQAVVINGLNSAVLSTSTTGEYKVLVTNTVNGCATVGTVKVINGTLDPKFEADHLSGYASLPVNFTNLSSSTTGTTNINTVWNFGNGTSSITASANIMPNTVYNLPGTYTVTAFVNKGTCTGTYTQVIMVEIPSELEIPNIFTPNGDNVNDVFFLKTANLAKISILIYDRWGHKVYELETEKGNIAWDGKNQFGKEVSEGTYFYVIKAEGKDDKSFTRKGNITLMR